MKYVVYLDVFFAINFFMDLIILVIAKKFINPQTTIKRCILGALAGTTLTCIITVKPFGLVILQKIFTYVVIPSVMTMVCCRVKNVITYFKVMAVIYVTTFVLSGVINWLYYFTGIGFYLKKINVTLFIFITIIAYFITDFTGKFIKSKMSMQGKGNDIYDVILKFRGKEIKLKGLYDTGNSLTEPIEGTPVHIVEYDGIKNLLEGVEANGIKIRAVPYKAIGTKTGVLKAIEIDMICIEADSRYIEIERALVGIYNGSMSSTNAYQMILNRSIKKWL